MHSELRCQTKLSFKRRFKQKTQFEIEFNLTDKVVHYSLKLYTDQHLSCCIPSVVHDTSLTVSPIPIPIPKRFGYLPPNYDSFDQLCANADEKFFNVRYNPNHVLHQLLPSVKCSGYNLRSRRHNYTLPNNNTTLISNNFINRTLFADMY